MFRTSLRRAATLVAATALVSAGVSAGVGTAVAGAATTSCPSSVTKTFPASLATITVTKKVISDPVVAPGGTVTYQTTVSSGGALLPPTIDKMGDYHPAGFTLTGARVNAWDLISLPPGQQWFNVQMTDEGNNLVTTSNPGWLINKGNTVTLETTYTVPANAQPGTVLDSGALVHPTAWANAQVWNPMGVCVTIRSQNIGETGSSALQGAGLGSSSGGLADWLSGIIAGGIQGGIGK